MPEFRFLRLANFVSGRRIIFVDSAGFSVEQDATEAVYAAYNPGLYFLHTGSDLEQESAEGRFGY